MPRIFLLIAFFGWSFSISANDELLNRFVAIREKVIEFYGKYFDETFPNNATHVEKLTILSAKRHEPDVEGYYQKFLNEFESGPEGIKAKYGLMAIGHELNQKTPLDFESFIEFFRYEDPVLFKYWQMFVDAKDENIERREKKKTLIIKIVTDSIRDRYKGGLPHAFQDFVGVLAVAETDFSHALFLQQLKDSPFFHELLPRVKAKDKTLWDFIQTTTDLDKMLFTRKSTETFDFHMPKLTTKKGQGQHLHTIMEVLNREESSGLFNFVQLDNGRFEVFYSQLQEAYRENFQGDPLSIVLEMPAVKAGTARIPKVALPLSTWRLFTEWPETLGEERMQQEIKNFVNYFTKSEALYWAFLYWSSKLSGKDVSFVKSAQETTIREEIIHCCIKRNYGHEKITPPWLLSMNYSLACAIQEIFCFLTQSRESEPATEIRDASHKKSAALPPLKKGATQPKKTVEKKETQAIPVTREPEIVAEVSDEVKVVTPVERVSLPTNVSSHTGSLNKKKKKRSSNKEKVDLWSDYRNPKALAPAKALSKPIVIALENERVCDQKKVSSPNPSAATPVEKKSPHSDAPTAMDRYFANKPWEQQQPPRKKSAQMPMTEQIINPKNTKPVDTIIEPIGQVQEPTLVVDIATKPLMQEPVKFIAMADDLPTEVSVEPMGSASNPDIPDLNLIKSEPSLSTEEHGDSFEDQIARLKLDAFDWQEWKSDDNWFAFNIFQQTWWGQFSWHFEELLDPKDYQELLAIFQNYVHLIGGITAERFKAHTLLAGVDIAKKKPATATDRIYFDLVEQAFWELCILRTIPVEDEFKETMGTLFAHDKALPMLETQLVEKLKETLQKEGEKLLHSREKTVRLVEKIKKFILPLSVSAEPFPKVL